ncbi:hypothetical protein HMPREF9072_02048, partial [Capnocytophaga sp. oral taxon 324 str. F0483]
SARAARTVFCSSLVIRYSFVHFLSACRATTLRVLTEEIKYLIYNSQL